MTSKIQEIKSKYNKFNTILGCTNDPNIIAKCKNVMDDLKRKYKEITREELI